jgi:hypothetical protein
MYVTRTWPTGRDKIARLFDSFGNVCEKWLCEWQWRWKPSIKRRHLFQFYLMVCDRLNKSWIEIGNCFYNFWQDMAILRLYFTLLSWSHLMCECSSSDDEVVQIAHYILWECCLWHDEKKTYARSCNTWSSLLFRPVKREAMGLPPVTSAVFLIANKFW